MAVHTGGTILKFADTAEGPFEKLVDVTNYPDLGSEPSKLDTTDLSATRYMTNILGLQEAPDLTFEANYDLDAFTTINSMDGEYFFNLEFGEDGVDGVYAWEGNVQVFVVGGGVDEVRKMNVIVSASTPVELKS